MYCRLFFSLFFPYFLFFIFLRLCYDPPGTVRHRHLHFGAFGSHTSSWPVVICYVLRSAYTLLFSSHYHYYCNSHRASSVFLLSAPPFPRSTSMYMLPQRRIQMMVISSSRAILGFRSHLADSLFLSAHFSQDLFYFFLPSLWPTLGSGHDVIHSNVVPASARS